MALERCRRQAARAKRRTPKSLAPVQALAAGSDLQSVEQQVEASAAPRRTSDTRMGVEWPGRQRKAKHEDSCDSVLLLCKATELAFGFRIEIVDQIRSFQYASTHSPKSQIGTLSIDGSGSSDIGRASSHRPRSLAEDEGEQLPLQFDHILGPVDESHFQVKRVVLSQMAARGMRLRTVDVPGFEHRSRPATPCSL